MKMRQFVASTVVAFAAASSLNAQQHQHAPTGARSPDMSAMHCGGMSMTSGTAAAQHNMPGMGRDSMHQMMDTNMMAMMGPPTPAAILQRRTQLGLNASQVQRLEGLEKEAEAACTGHMRLAMAAHEAANQLLDVSAPDFAAYAAKLKEATAHMVEGHVVMARAAVAARDVLTAQQRQTLKGRTQGMHEHP